MSIGNPNAIRGVGQFASKKYFAYGSQNWVRPDKGFGTFGCQGELELELELIQTRMIQKPLLWVEVGKSASVLVAICELRLSLPARYDPQCPSLFD
jgi:hypothetical protein